MVRLFLDRHESIRFDIVVKLLEFLFHFFELTLIPLRQVVLVSQLVLQGEDLSIRLIGTLLILRFEAFLKLHE